MKTMDIVKLGINRNFIRECERQGLIHPNRVAGTMVINENYYSREYSDVDLQIIWGSLLLRKMDIPFSDIKKWWNGENINLRNQINISIEKCESEVEELLTIVDFMKHVRATGVLLEPPKTMNTAYSFKDFITEYLKTIDLEKDKVKILDLLHRKIELENIQENELTEVQQLELSTIKEKIDDYCLNEFRGASASEKKAWKQLYEILEDDKHANSEETINRVLEQFNEAFSMKVTPFEFLWIMWCFVTEDSDFAENMAHDVGMENIDRFFRAAFEYAKNKDLEKFQSFLQKIPTTESDDMLRNEKFVKNSKQKF